jgi:dTDP-4-dehydrorhamnose reductase
MAHCIVTGAAGQLGQELVRLFEARGWKVSSFDRSTLDITSQDAVESALAPLHPDLVINAAAYNQVDIAEREALAAIQVNGLGVRNLALACRAADAQLVHFSTDYVFDGRKGSAYVESDEPHPISAYGVSKLAGELYARAYLDRALIIRTSGVYGNGAPRGNFVESMLRAAGKNQPIRVVADHIASPTFVPELARFTADLVAAGALGIVHGGGGEAISWFDYARLIFQTAGLNPDLHPTDEREYRTAAKRPKFSALENRRAAECGVAPMAPLAECLNRYFAARGR